MGNVAFKNKKADVVTWDAQIKDNVDEIMTEAERIIKQLEPFATDRQCINQLKWHYVDRLNKYFNPVTIKNTGEKIKLGVEYKPEQTDRSNQHKKKICDGIVSFYKRKLDLIKNVRKRMTYCDDLEVVVFDNVNQTLATQTTSSKDLTKFHKDFKGFKGFIDNYHGRSAAVLKALRDAKDIPTLDDVFKRAKAMFNQADGVCEKYEMGPFLGFTKEGMKNRAVTVARMRAEKESRNTQAEQNRGLRERVGTEANQAEKLKLQQKELERQKTELANLRAQNRRDGRVSPRAQNFKASTPPPIKRTRFAPPPGRMEPIKSALKKTARDIAPIAKDIAPVAAPIAAAALTGGVGGAALAAARGPLPNLAAAKIREQTNRIRAETGTQLESDKRRNEQEIANKNELEAVQKDLEKAKRDQAAATQATRVCREGSICMLEKYIDTQGQACQPGLVKILSKNGNKLLVEQPKNGQLVRCNVTTDDVGYIVDQDNANLIYERKGLTAREGNCEIDTLCRYDGTDNNCKIGKMELIRVGSITPAGVVISDKERVDKGDKGTACIVPMESLTYVDQEKAQLLFIPIANGRGTRNIILKNEEEILNKKNEVRDERERINEAKKCTVGVSCEIYKNIPNDKIGSCYDDTNNVPTANMQYNKGDLVNITRREPNGVRVQKIGTENNISCTILMNPNEILEYRITEDEQRQLLGTLAGLGLGN